MKQIRVKFQGAPWHTLEQAFDNEDNEVDRTANAVQEALGLLLDADDFTVDILSYPAQMRPDGEGVALTQDGADDLASLIFQAVQDKQQSQMRAMAQQRAEDIMLNAPSYKSYKERGGHDPVTMINAFTTAQEALADVITAITGELETLLRLLTKALTHGSESTPGTSVQTTGFMPTPLPTVRLPEPSVLSLNPLRFGASELPEWVQVAQGGLTPAHYLEGYEAYGKTWFPLRSLKITPATSNPAKIEPTPDTEEKPHEPPPTPEPVHFDLSTCANCGAQGKPLFESRQYHGGRVCGRCHAKEV